MKEHTDTIAGTGSDSVCLANGGKKGQISVTDGESSISELMAKIERQCAIIGDLLVTNEELRHRLRSIEYSAQSSSTRHSNL
jgi:hypothetical protein